MGRLIPIPPPEKALAYLATRERSPESEQRRRAIVGTPERVREGLEAVAAEYGTDDVMVLTITHDHEARRRSYELIAEVMSSHGAPDDGRRAVGEARRGLRRLTPADAAAAVAAGAVLVDIRSER